MLLCYVMIYVFIQIVIKTKRKKNYVRLNTFWSNARNVNQKNYWAPSVIAPLHKVSIQ